MEQDNMSQQNNADGVSHLICHNNSKRVEKIGIVVSDKMLKTVVIRVDRFVQHPKYRRYIRRTSKFMAHDEMDCKAGDKVRISEMRPLSARKRWRVIEVIQKSVR